MRLRRWSCSPRSAEGEQAENLLLLLLLLLHQNLLQQMTGAEEVNVEGDEEGEQGEQVRQSARRRLKKLLKRCSWSLKKRFLLRQHTLEMELLRWSAALDGSGGDGVTGKRCCCCSDHHLLPKKCLAEDEAEVAAAAARAQGCPVAVKTAAPERCTAGSSGAAGSSEEEGEEKR